jgi:hypothetical protein
LAAARDLPFGFQLRHVPWPRARVAGPFECCLWCEADTDIDEWWN